MFQHLPLKSKKEIDKNWEKQGYLPIKDPISDIAVQVEVRSHIVRTNKQHILPS